MEEKDTFSADREIDVIIGFLDDIKNDSERIKILMEELKVFRKHSVLKQVEKYHEILKLFQCLNTDVGINSERVKRIASSLKEDAAKAGIDAEWAEVLKKEDRWNFDW